MCCRHTADGAKYTIPVNNNETVVLRDILNEVLERRKLRIKTGIYSESVKHKKIYFLAFS